MPKSILSNCRNSYRAVRRALPWLDASYWPDDPPAFGRLALPVEHATVKSAVLRSDSTGRIEQMRAASGIMLWRWIPEASGPLAGLESAILKLVECKSPLVVRQTDITFHELELFALAHPQLAVILESGPRKLLYHLQPIESKMLKCPNLYLSTYNFCNWLGIERLHAKGLLQRLLFGSHAPRYSPDVAMGPIVMSALSWEEKCAIAGNNLRRLLSIPLKITPAQKWNAGENFIIDAHAHNVAPGSRNLFGFPTPDEDFSPADWVANLDYLAIEQAFLIPCNALTDKNISAGKCTAPLRQHAPDRFRYMTVFHPAMNATQCARVAAELADKTCVGLKIHPSTHELEADHPSFEKAYRMAIEAGKPVVTHSWEISDYNPVQQLAHPGRFRRQLAAHPEVTLVLGHAGGRPSTLEAVVNICREFPKTVVDVSGDYFDNGVFDCLAGRLGVDKVMFGSDVDWVDQRCNLGPIFACRLPDEDVFKILRANARRVFLRAT